MPRPRPANRRRTLSNGQWWFLAFALLVALPVVLGFAFFNQIYDLYLQEFIEPALQPQLGFTGGLVTIFDDNGRQYQWYGIKSVTPGGEFARVGINPA